MADDVVTRLRQYTPEAQNSSNETRTLLNDAATEIGRLREVEQNLRAYLEQDACTIERLHEVGDALVAAIRNHDLREEHLRVWENIRRGWPTGMPGGCPRTPYEHHTATAPSDAHDHNATQPDLRI